MPNRNVEGNYRYGYQGEFAEKEPELGNGISSFELRLYDARIGRWTSPDPKKQYHSPYMAMGNNPINGVDPDGGCFTSSTDDNGNTTYTPCADGEIGATMTGAFGYEWTMTENDGWQLTNGADPSTVTASYSAVDPDGSPEYYIERYKKHIEEYNTRPPDYYLGYGHKYINRFKNETRTTLSDDGKQWLDKTAVSLQELMESGIQANPEMQLNNNVFQSFAYDTHVPAYLGSGLADLPLTDFPKIGLTPDFSDLLSKDGIKQAHTVGTILQIHWGIKTFKSFVRGARPRFF